MSTGVVQGVLDLTFLDLKEEADIERVLVDKILTVESPSKTGRIKSEDVKAIRLANNNIEDLDILACLSRGVDCTKVLWIDLSFNEIKIISESFLSQFPNATTIYLHANQISTLVEIKKLAVLESLKSISVYGNPVEEKKV